MFKKSKFIFIFLLLLFVFGVVLSLTSFSSFNLNSPILSALDKNKNRKMRMKKEVEKQPPTKIEWNTHMAKIKPVLKILASFNKPTITFNLQSPNELTNYSVTNLIKVQNINAQYTEMSSEAQEELRFLYAQKLDDIELTRAYEGVLQNFFRDIAPHLKILQTIGKITIAIESKTFEITNLVNVLETGDWKTNKVAKEELIALYTHSSDSSWFNNKFQTVYKTILNPFLLGIKSTLIIFTIMSGTTDFAVVSDLTEFQIVGVEKPFSIKNLLIYVLEKSDWETNTAASKELAILYQHNSNPLMVQGQLQTAYKEILDSFLEGIKPSLQVLKAYGATEVQIAGEPTSFCN